jgi:hypothetical protein
VAAGNNGESRNEIIIEDWFSLIRYLMGIGLIIFGLHSLLYSHIATYFHLHQYKHHAQSIKGDVLSCESTPAHSTKSFEMQVLYSAKEHTYKKKNNHRSRKEFRYPDAFTTKQFLRRFETDWHAPRGTTLELLLLPNAPRSALTPELLHDKQQDHSHFRTALIFIPGGLLIASLIALSVWEIETFESLREKRIGCFVFAVALVAFLLISRAVCDVRFQKEKNRIFNSAVTVRPAKVNEAGIGGSNSTTPGHIPIVATAATGAGGEVDASRSEPLIPFDHKLPIVYGKEVH